MRRGRLTGAGGARRSAPVLYEKRGPVAIVSLNRPESLNAYDIAMRDALEEALLAVRDDPEVRAMVLRGNGRAFSSGGDLREFGTAPSPLGARHARWARDVWGALRGLVQPTIAAVHGFAAGGGFEMAMLCDLRIAARNTRFGLPETGLGMIPGVGGTQTVPRAVGLGRGMDLVLTGRWLGAAEALALGLVTSLVPRRDLDAAALALGERLAALDPDLLAKSKRAVWGGVDMPLSAALAWERVSSREF